MSELKWCNLCEKWKNLEEFGKHSGRKSGIDSKCKECNKKKANDWYRKNSERAKNNVKKYREKNREKYLNNGRKYYQKNKERYREYGKENVEIINKNRRRRRSEGRESPRYKLRCSISISIVKKLRRRLSSKKGKQTWSFLPYTVDELMQHLENLFTEGMSWKNYGKWHIDHKKPDSLFNYNSVDDEEFQNCWALKNLQPLWAIDNIKKSNKY